MLKTILCLKYLKNFDEFPSFDYVKNFGHNLIDLKTKYEKEFINVKRTSKTSEYFEDYNFIKENAELKNIIQILSDFAENGRYFNLNIVVQSNTNAPNYLEEWNKNISTLILKKLDLPFEAKNTKTDNKSIKKVYIEVIKLFEKFIRALAREYVSNNLSEEAKACHIYFLHFLILEDDNLGKEDYSKRKLVECT